MHTITSDHGTAFHGYAALEAQTHAQFYFATPHDCRALARTLNQRSRKRLGYRTPEECYVP